MNRMTERRGKRMTRNGGKETPAAVTQHLSPSQTHRPLPRFTSVLPECFHRGVLSVQDRPALFWHLMTLFPRFYTMLDGLWFDTRQTSPTSIQPTYYFCFLPIHAKSTQLTTLPFLCWVLEINRCWSILQKEFPFICIIRLNLRVNQCLQMGHALKRPHLFIYIWHNLAPRSFQMQHVFMSYKRNRFLWANIVNTTSCFMKQFLPTKYSFMWSTCVSIFDQYSQT